MIGIGDYKKLKTKKRKVSVIDQKGNPINEIPEYRPEFNNDENNIEESNMLLDVMKSMDNDIVQADNLTSIDFNSRLSSSEISNLSALQLLYSLKVGGSGLGLITRIIKRNKVSLDGLGRTEKVQMVQGDREHQEGVNTNKSIFGKMRGLFKNGNQNETPK